MSYRAEGGFGAGLVSALLIAAGLTGAGWFVASGIVESRVVDRRVTVKGLAEQEVKADLALWPMTIQRSGDNLAEIQDAIEADVVRVKAFLEGAGFDIAEISEGRLTLEDRVAQSWGPEAPRGGRYLISQPLQVRSTDVDLVAGQSRELGELVRQGVVLTGWQGPSYSFTKLNDIKPSMIEAATKNAREAAVKFAEDSGARLGSIYRADQGLFVIRPRDDIMGEDESSQIFKRVRVVTTITYLIDD